MDPHKGKKQTSTKPGYSVHGGSQQPASQIGPGAGSLTILSSILRSPHPSLQKAPGKPQDVSAAALGQMAASRSRGQSPVRVITTTMTPGSSGPSPKASGLSPSRVPTTLPPKKSLSPSRTIYTEGHSPTPKQRVATPPRNPSPSSGGAIQSQGQGRTAKILSHLPYLQHTLQGGTPEKLFQQYKARKPPDQQQKQPASSQPVQKVVVLETSQSQGQPRPAHQVQCSPPPPQPHHVSTIRRTPSPAHMPIGADTKAKVLVEHLSMSQAAVNLVKTTDAMGKDLREGKWTDAEFKYGDLLRSINKSHDAIQAPLLQRNLSPITPADPTDSSKAWVPGLHMSPHGVVVSQPGLGYSPQAPGQPTASTLQTLQLASSAASHGQVMVTIPAPSSYPSVAPVGFTPVVLPSHAQKSSPKGQVRQSNSPKSRTSVVASSSTLPVHAVSSQPTAVSYVHMPVPSSGSSQPTAVSYVHMPVPSSGSRGDVKVYPTRDMHRYTATSLDTSVTQAGPPNITISSCSTIIPQDKITVSQKHPKNPFTFPATPPISLTNERPLGRAITHTSQSKLMETEVKVKKERHTSGEMPCLMPVSPVSKEKMLQIKEEADTDMVEIPQPYNMRLQNLANFPNNSTYRPTYRATSVAIHKAKVACITNSAKSLDILRQNLQKSINKEIDAVVQSYMNKYFKIGVDNIKLNNGDTSVTDDHIQAVSRQILEEAKKMYITDTGSRVSVSPVRDLSDNMSETGSSGRRSALGRRRHPSDTDSEKSVRPGNKKKKGRFVGSLTGRSTPSKLSQQQVKREGPKFEPERLTEETLFVMGSKANKAMGFGQTRGRLYMKHPDLFKYGGDQDDKTWLYEHQHMPATGGKSYLVVLEDVRELVLTDEYRDSPGINIGVLAGFRVPMWMIEKMRAQMVAMRTDLPKQPRYRSRSATPNEPSFLTEVDDGHSPPKDLPFSSFSSPKQKTSAIEASPNNLEYLAGGGAGVDDPVSPFNMTGGFDDTASQSDVDTLEEEGAFSIAH